MFNFKFWQKWLLFLCFYLIFFGFLIAVFNQSYLMNVIFNSYINPVFWTDGNVPAQSMIYIKWINGVLGATIMGWGIFMAYITAYPFKAKEKWSWNCVFVGITIWFLIDTFLSAYYLVYINIILNILLYVLFMIPLFFTRKHFG